MNEPSEWLKVMLGEIERKRMEASEMEREEKRRAQSSPPDSEESHSK